LGELSAQEMAEAAGMSEADVVAAMGLIQSLDPRPGLKYSAPPPMYVMPEVEIRGSPELGYVVEMLKDTWPRLYISEDYQEMLADPETAEEARKYLTEKIRDGKFVLDSLQQRQETVQRIAQEIAETQAEFFEHGITKLKPLTLSSVAEKLGVHDTTVGRAVADKYVKTPQGVFELKFFFPSGVKTADGGAMAAAAVKETLARLIAREDVRKPLSDQALAKLLGEQGIQIARRTVAKYREELGLPPAHQRK
ncbi:MAG TPA: RNA polymerase sigma-54 factor, partial [Kiritimatiellia bacterium]|nr:RNA polymerase sigma-54 factor [Kiritimatiellia bacterium]